MANAQLLEEELQQSVMVSEEDAEYDEDDGQDHAVEGQQSASAAGTSDADSKDGVGDEDDSMEDAEYTVEADDDADPLEDGPAGSGEDEQDKDAEAEDDDGDFEDDAEGEVDDDVTAHLSVAQDIPSIESDGEEDDEGVGAVKLKPGEFDEDGSEGSDRSEPSASGEESEDDAEWEETAENEEEENKSENDHPNACIFCKQDEENDPSEEFEAYLACSGCDENGVLPSAFLGV